MVPSTAQNKVTIKNPSRVCSSCFDLAVTSQSNNPMEKVVKKEMTKADAVLSSYIKETIIGGKLLKQLNSISNMPRIFIIMEKCIFLSIVA
jgi:hypothetical protein